MSVSLILVASGALAAVVGTGVLVTRCTSAPRLYLMIWSLALFALVVGLGAQAAGYLAGYSAVLFRAMELGVQAVAPLALSLAVVEIVGRSVPARFAMRLAVSSIAVVTIVILATDPLSAGTAFGKTWPDPAVVYEPVPRLLLEFLLAPFAVLTAVASMLTAGLRRKHSRRDGDAVVPVVAGGFAIIALTIPVVLVLTRQYAGITLPASASGLFALCGLLAAALGWFGGARAVPAPAGQSGSQSEGGGGAYDDQADYGDGHHLGPATGQWHDSADGDERYSRRAGYGRNGASPGEQDYGDGDSEYRYPALAALAAEPEDMPASGGWYDERDLYRDGYAAEESRNTPGRYPSRSFRDGGHGHGDLSRYGGQEQTYGRYGDNSYGYDSYGGDAGDGYERPYADGDSFSGGYGYQPTGLDTADGTHSGADPNARLFGQIVIYSLVEAHVEAFDRLTERVVAQVRESEPDTLVYIVHQVPAAPLQRILYEVYRDRAAYEDHVRLAYIRRYDDERQPFIAGMNVVELGLQQAKVSPLPSIAEILTESGIDLTNVTGSARRAAPRERVGAWPHGNELPAPPGWDGVGGEPGWDQRPGPSSYPYGSGREGAGSEPGWDAVRRQDSWYR